MGAGHTFSVQVGHCIAAVPQSAVFIVCRKVHVEGKAGRVADFHLQGMAAPFMLSLALRLLFHGVDYFIIDVFVRDVPGFRAFRHEALRRVAFREGDLSPVRLHFEDVVSAVRCGGEETMGG